MTKMAAMAINSKRHFKIFFSITRRHTNSKPGTKHQGEELYKVYINHGPGMTLTNLMARSTYGALAFEWGKLSKCHLKGKTLWKWANGLNIYDSENKCARGTGLPPLRGKIHVHVYYHNIQRPSLTPLGQSKPNFMWNILRKEE